MKINYTRKWDGDGMSYTQTVTTTLTSKQISEINARIGRLSFARIFGSRFFIGAGMNFVTLSAARLIAEYLGLNNNSRYKTDRNTAFNITIA